MSADTDASDSTNSSSTVTRSSVPAPSGSGAAGPLFERVLVVTTDTDAGRAAVDAGVEIAAAHGANVDALYVVDTTEHWDMAVERYEREGETLVEDAESRGADAGVDVEKWFRYGTAHREVLDFAAAHDADLIVVGSARRTGFDRLVHPETLPVRVQRGASAPVLIVGADD
ncbi:universal stress protein [Halorubrum pallidum]